MSVQCHTVPPWNLHQVFPFPRTATWPVKVCEQCSQLVPSWELTFYGFVWMPVRHIQRWLWQQVAHWMEWKKRWVSWWFFHHPKIGVSSWTSIIFRSLDLLFFFLACVILPHQPTQKRNSPIYHLTWKKKGHLSSHLELRSLKEAQKDSAPEKLKPVWLGLLGTSVSLTSQRSLTLAMVQ